MPRVTVAVVGAATIAFVGFGDGLDSPLHDDVDGKKLVDGRPHSPSIDDEDQYSQHH